MNNLRFAAITPLLALATFASAQSNDVKREIGDIYNKGSNLLISQDMRSFVRFAQETHTQGYLMISKRGKYPLKEVLRSMAVMLSTYRVSKVVAQIEKVDLKGDVATVRLTSKVELETQPTKSKVHLTLGQEVQCEDSWIRTGGKWKLNLSTILAEKETQNGKPVGKN